MNWILENLSTIIISSILTIIVIMIIKKMHRDRKNGSCGGDCGGCGASCHSTNKESLLQEYYQTNKKSYPLG